LSSLVPVSSVLINMPHYELGMVVRYGLNRGQLTEVVKRCGVKVLETGGYIRKVEFLGERQLPQKQNKFGVTHSKGNYFMFKCDVKSAKVRELLDELHRDQDLLRRFIVLCEREAEEETPPPCSLEDELKPPSERPSVATLIDMGKQPPRFAHIWDDRTDLGYYPFKKG